MVIELSFNLNNHASGIHDEKFKPQPEGRDTGAKPASGLSGLDALCK